MVHICMNNDTEHQRKGPNIRGIDIFRGRIHWASRAYAPCRGPAKKKECMRRFDLGSKSVLGCGECVDDAVVAEDETGVAHCTFRRPALILVFLGQALCGRRNGHRPPHNRVVRLVLILPWTYDTETPTAASIHILSRIVRVLQNQLRVNEGPAVA